MQEMQNTENWRGSPLTVRNSSDTTWTGLTSINFRPQPIINRPFPSSSDEVPPNSFVSPPLLIVHISNGRLRCVGGVDGRCIEFFYRCGCIGSEPNPLQPRGMSLWAPHTCSAFRTDAISIFLLPGDASARGFVSSLDRRRHFWTPMAAAAAATAAALTVLLCLLLCMREGAVEEGVAGDASDGVVLERHRSGGRWRKRQQSPTEPPVTWMGKLALVVGTIRFTFSETLGRWPLVDLLFGIKHHMRRQVSDYVLLIGRICSLLQYC
ncbi:hypothetical protein B296_00001872 [Ensete ventricosum]|uniref:Uncharacterized protein n=1 Tax=Ensete ventricosum TaxID=4639 RepID=A0A427A5I3_ENSVE|nr:hypothetical protein B296_00001872 [Ensete ventricosum]